MTIGVAVFIRGAREGGRLLDQLPDIVAQNCDAVFEFGERKRTAVGIVVSSWSANRLGAVRPRKATADRPL